MKEQRTKIHNSYSPYVHIPCGFPQGSMLGSLLFNTNTCNMFLEKYGCDIVSYVDDKRPQTHDSELYTALGKLKNCTENLFTSLRKIIISKSVKIG